MEFKTKPEDSTVQISDDTLAKLRSANLKQLTTKAKAEMARMLGSWFEANMGRDSAKIREIRELSTRLLEAVEEDELLGETIVFVNNYVAFLIVECENDLARQVLEVWVRKVKAAGNIEWILLLFSSYVELVVRSSEAKQAAQKVTKIVGLVSKHVESAKRAKLTPLLIKSYCAILVNHAKLTLANEESSDAVENVKATVAAIRKYNALYSPDPSIENLVSKIESIYTPAPLRLEKAFTVLSKRIQKTDSDHKQANNLLQQSADPSSSLKSAGLKANQSTLPTTDSTKRSAQGFRIQRGTSLSRGRAQSNFKKSATQKEGHGKKAHYRDVQSEEGLHEERELDFAEIKALKETTKVALEGLLEVRRNKELLKELRVFQSTKVDRGAKTEFVGKLDRLMAMVNTQLNDIKSYSEKIDHLEKYGLTKPKVITPVGTSNKPSKDYDQDDSTSPIKNDPFVASQTSIKELPRPGSMRQISSRLEIGPPRQAKVSNSEGQRSLISRGNSEQISEGGLDFSRPKGSSFQRLDSPESPPIISTKLASTQALFFNAYHLYRLKLKEKGSEVLNGSFVDEGKLHFYTFKATFKPQDLSLNFTISISSLRQTESGCAKVLSEQQFLAIVLVILQNKDNYLDFTYQTPFTSFLKYYIMSHCRPSENGNNFTFTSRPGSWLTETTVNLFDRQWEVSLQHIRSGSLFILLFSNKRDPQECFSLEVVTDSEKAAVQASTMKEVSESVLESLKLITCAKQPAPLEALIETQLGTSLSNYGDTSSQLAVKIAESLQRITGFWNNNPESSVAELQKGDLYKTLIVPSAGEPLYTECSIDQTGGRLEFRTVPELISGQHFSSHISFLKIKTDLGLNFSSLSKGERTHIQRLYSQSIFPSTSSAINRSSMKTTEIYNGPVASYNSVALHSLSTPSSDLCLMFAVKPTPRSPVSHALLVNPFSNSRLLPADSTNWPDLCSPEVLILLLRLVGLQQTSSADSRVVVLDDRLCLTGLASATLAILESH